MLCYRASSQQQRGVWSLRQGTGKTNYEVTTTKMHVCFAKTKKNLKKDIQISREIYKPGKRSDRHARAYTDICKQTKIKTHTSQTGCVMSQVEINGQLMQLKSDWGTILSHSVSHDQSPHWETGKAIDLSVPCRHTHTQTSFTSQIIFWTQLDLLLLLSERCCWGTPWRLYP